VPWNAYKYTYVLASEVLLSPILVRPVREQLEHDRVIRLLQAKHKRKFEVAINPGNEQTAPVGGPPPWYPDVVLQSLDRNRKLQGVIEVETAESVNNLEAMSQWVAFSKLRVPFHLYVPAACIDSVRRLCTDLEVTVAELWAYSAIGDQLRFTLVQRSAQAEAKAARAASEAASSQRARPAAPARTSPSRARTNGPAVTRPARRVTPAAAPAATRRPATTKAKTAAPRRAVKSASRKSAAAPSRAQKRR
jgi:hypothetical protein